MGKEEVVAVVAAQGLLPPRRRMHPSISAVQIDRGWEEMGGGFHMRRTLKGEGPITPNNKQYVHRFSLADSVGGIIMPKY